MSRSLRRSSRGAFGSRSSTKLSSMVVMLIILGLIYTRARDPQTWRWLASDAAAEAEPLPRPASVAVPTGRPTRSKPVEAVVPEATDVDPEEEAAALGQFAAISDKAPLTHSEMPAYWRLMRWARAQSFDELSRRARRDVSFAQLWEQPEKYRGQPLRLRLHVKRILEYEAPKNSAKVERVYEAWGWTDESKSYPYVVVFSELPPGMHVGDDVQEEGIFVGYFLKTMSYTAFDKGRAAPLVVGRMRAVERSIAPAPRWASSTALWIAGGCVALLTILVVVLTRRKARTRRANSKQVPVDDATIADWLINEQGPGAPAPVASANTAVHSQTHESGLGL
ncbi:MAG: hypothetical protein EXS05_01720 [Planctomycetaceae bacterium]|nr:hypothetical protein [Planctomycetaceae bacterium]